MGFFNQFLFLLHFLFFDIWFFNLILPPLSDAYVAIKRILSPFDQEIDAVRLYREIHILRRLRGHSCIINLLDIVQPPTDDLDDFHDLYLVFECTSTPEAVAKKLHLEPHLSFSVCSPLSQMSTLTCTS